MFGLENWISMGRHAQKSVRSASSLSSTKVSTLTESRDWSTIASATTPQKQEHTSVKTPFASKQG